MIEDGDGMMMLTIFLKHQKDKSLAEINSNLDQTEFWRHFPPEGCDIASWYVMMGIGHVVTLKLSAEMLRDVNLAIETTGLGCV